MQEVKANLERFCKQHGVELVEEGECGFCRPCVGILGVNECYVDYNPIDEKNDYKRIAEYYDKDLNAPDGVDAYHKHNCLAVLVHDDDYEEGLRRLNKWVEHIESKGEVEIIKKPTGYTGLELMLKGSHVPTIRFKRKF